MSDPHPSPPRAISTREVVGLCFLFGALYFAQGVGEPSDGLIAQPSRSLLKSWGHTTGQITSFGAWLVLPWTFKPLFGLLTDFLPLAGSRRRSYLILNSLLSMLALFALFWFPPAADGIDSFLRLLVLASIGVAFTDVVTDALMVEAGQPRGITGLLQSVQWTAMYSAMILTGTIGGWLSKYDQQHWGFLLAGGASAVALGLGICLVRERPSPSFEGRSEQGFEAARGLWHAFRTPVVWVAAAFLFCLNFNPFRQVIYPYMTISLHLSEEFYGYNESLLGLASVLGCISYGFLCRWISFGRLIQFAILANLVSVLAYWGLVGPKSALIVTFAVGYTYMLATLTQLDLAARVCPPAAAGTVFALLMAESNLGDFLAGQLGGWLYDPWAARWGDAGAFHALVAIGAAFTAVCFLLTPWLRLRSE